MTNRFEGWTRATEGWVFGAVVAVLAIAYIISRLG
jgi:hypothetical protein